MVGSLVHGFAALIAAVPTPQELSDKITLDSSILSEQFYYWTVVVMWLIHVGFMSYEAGAGRRKNVMATAMKNILTIAVVTPTFYYFGWWIYGCFSKGIIPNTPGDLIGPAHSATDNLMGTFCSTTYPWAANFGPNLTDHLSCILGSVIWILDASWGWSAFGFLNMRWGFHDSIAGLVVHGVAGAFTLGVLLNLGPRIGKYTREGLARTFRPHNLHLTLMGLMLIFTGFYAFYAACLVIQSTTLPGWGNIYFNPTTLSSITFAITIGFAGGFTGGDLPPPGQPLLALFRGLAGVVSGSAGAGRFGVPGVAGFWTPLAAGLFAAGYPTGLNNVDSTLTGQLYGMMVFLPLGFFGGYIPSWIMKKLNILRVPPEVELEGLDMAEFQADFYPEFDRPPEVVILPDGTQVESAPILLEGYHEVMTNGRVRAGPGERVER